MKKLLFTALAVVAFSGVSFAKTGEVEIVNPISSEKIVLSNIKFEKFKVDDSRDSNGIRVQAYLIASSRGYSDREARSIGWSNYWSCMSASL